MSLQIRDLSKSFGPRSLFSGITFSVNPGERVALVGVNGSGKTTLMRIILGRESPDSGKVTMPRDAVAGYLPQEIFLDREDGWKEQDAEMSLWELVSNAFSRLRDVERKLSDIDERMAEGDFSPSVLEQREIMMAAFERLGGYNWQARMIRVLKGLGFPEERFHEPLNHFSGGWRMRAYFARILLSSPDFLLLDEPTNYLDIASISFIEEYLSAYPGGILVVSHDRYFLDNLGTTVVALMPEGARTYRGNYSEFLVAREQWAQEAESAYKRREREVRRIERFIERFRYKATKASQVQSRIKMLAKIPEIQTLSDSRKLDFDFISCQESGEVVLSGKGIAKAYGPLKVLQDLDFMVYRKDRLAIIGENGMGKSTLMRIIASQDRAFSGALSWGYRVFPAYFAQDEEISFEKEETVWERMLRETPLDKADKLRNLLGMFLFSGDMIKQKVRSLSGGEKSRLGLARMLLRPTNLLLLDEPTNHLDISSREALLDALDSFPGTLVFVSHDRYFLDSLATRIIALDNGKAIVYEGDYGQYLWSRRQKWADVPENKPNESGGGPPTWARPPEGGNNGAGNTWSQARDEWKAKKKLSNQRQRWERELTQIEDEISKIENKYKEVEEKLACPVPGTSREALTNLTNEHVSLKKQIDDAMAKWEELHRLLGVDRN